MNRLRQRANFALVIAAALVVGLVLFALKYLRCGRDWALSPVNQTYYDSGVLRSGTLTDRNGVVLAHMGGGEESYAEDAALRESCLHVVGDFAGNIGGGALRLFSEELSGYDLVSGAYDPAGDGGVVALSIDAEMQMAALQALAGRSGAVAVCNYKTGELLCMVSSPAFDPLIGPSESADGSYINRVTGATYAPGSVYKLVTLCAAIENIPDLRQRSFFCSGSMDIGGVEVKCSGIHGTQTIEQAFANSCNCAFAEISLELGAQKLAEYAQKLGITAELSLEGYPVKRGSFEPAASGSADLAWSGIGQYTDLVSPFAMLRLSAVIAAGGKAPELRLLRGGSGAREAVLSAETADELADMMRYAVVSNYGDWRFPELSLCAKTGTAELGDGTSHAWFTGFLRDEDAPYAFVAVIEHGGSGISAAAPVVYQVLQSAVEN